MTPRPGVIGVPRRRVDGRAMVTGQRKYADDLTLPRMAFARLLRSPVPHARITSIDTTRAAAHPGVLLVLTGRDLPIPYGILPVTQDEHALAIDKVRFVGDPVALVVARDEATATDALDLVDVRYEPLTTIAGFDDALTVAEGNRCLGDMTNVRTVRKLSTELVPAWVAVESRQA